jgi:hypothetical protein
MALVVQPLSGWLKSLLDGFHVDPPRTYTDVYEPTIPRIHLSLLVWPIRGWLCDLLGGEWGRDLRGLARRYYSHGRQHDLVVLPDQSLRSL